MKCGEQWLMVMIRIPQPINEHTSTTNTPEAERKLHSPPGSRTMCHEKCNLLYAFFAPFLLAPAQMKNGSCGLGVGVPKKGTTFSLAPAKFIKCSTRTFSHA